MDKKQLQSIGIVERYVVNGGYVGLKLATSLGSYNYLFIEIDTTLVPYRIEETEGHTVKLTEITNEEDYKVIAGKRVFIENSIQNNNKSDNELIGYKVFDSDLTLIGQVEDVIEYPMQTLLLLHFENNEVLIPFTDGIVINVNTNEKTILVNLPEGLLDINR